MKDKDKVHTGQVEDLISAFEDENIDKQVDDIKDKNSMQELKLNIFKFFSSRLNFIQKKEKFAEEVQTQLRQKMNDDEVNFKDLMQLYKLCIQQNTFATDSITGLFKPAPGAPSPFTESMAKEEMKKDMYEEAFDSLKAEDLRKIDYLHRVLQEVSKKEEDKGE